MISRVELFNQVCPENNKLKLNKILEYWFLRFDSFLKINSKNSINKLEDTLKFNQNKNVIYAINQNLNGENGFPKKIIYNSALVKILLNFFFKFKIFKYLIISGGETKFSRLNDFISNLWIRAHINTDADLTKIDNLVKKKNDFIDLLDKNKIYEKKELNFLKKYFPLIFFVTKKKVILKELKVYGSLDNFLNDPNYLKLFLLVENLEIIGIMHGSGYGQFINHQTEDFEKKISDRYIYWFPFDGNKFIGRFSLNNKLNSKISKVFWIGKSNFNEFDMLDLPDQYIHQQKQDHLAHIDQKLFNIKNLYFVKGKTKNKTIWLPTFTKIFSKNIKIETQINNQKDILIFDCISQSLMYFAIKFKIPFIIIIYEDKISNIRGLKKKYIDFCLKLQKEDIIFNYKEIDKVYDKILSLKDSNNYKLEKQKLSNIINNFN